MRPVPEYPSYKMARPPVKARWLSAGALLVVLGGGIAALVPTMGSKTSLIMLGILLSLVLVGLGWLTSLLYYRVSVHNANFYQRLVADEQWWWWEQHRQPFSLQEVVLLGPVGCHLSDWLRLLKGECHRPEEQEQDGDKVLRLPQILSVGIPQREKRLAEMLVLEWQRQRNDKRLSMPLHCYWQGSEAAWQAFYQQMAVSFPDVILPLHPESWQGEMSLAAIAATLADAPSGSTLLVAGCQSVAAQPNTLLPAGESAVLWLVGQSGPVQLTRGEVYEQQKGDTLPKVCARALEQSELAQPPDTTILFSLSETEALARNGWDVSQHIQDTYWGDTGAMEALIVLSLAAIYAQHSQQPCGWIARDLNNTLALGIIKPYG